MIGNSSLSPPFTQGQEHQGKEDQGQDGHQESTSLDPAISPEDGLVAHDAHALTFPLQLNDRGLQTLDHVLVRLPGRIPGLQE